MNRPEYTVIGGCRSCDSHLLELVLDLGKMPLSDGLFDPDDDRSREHKYPLTLVRCVDCGLLQILETVDPTILFGPSYPYYSSFSAQLVANARSNVEGIIARKGLDGRSMAIELASNDGYLLQWFQKHGVPVLGVDPAPGPAAAATERGVPTVQGFFDVTLAEGLASDGIAADVIIGNNVLAHVPDQNALIEAMSRILKPDGAVVMEFPYAVEMIERCEFDTIYHEHHCYFTMHTVISLFERHGFGAVSVERLDIHGGSLRVWIEREGEPDGSVQSLLADERDRGVPELEYYLHFAERVELLKRDLKRGLEAIRAKGGTIVGYGAAAKGAILLNSCGIGPDLVDYIVDLNIHKHGLEMPGVAIPIHGVDRLKDNRPDYLLLLAWNFKDEIMRQQAWFPSQGGRFIVPIPEFALV